MQEEITIYNNQEAPQDDHDEFEREIQVEKELEADQVLEINDYLESNNDTQELNMRESLEAEGTANYTRNNQSVKLISIQEFGGGENTCVLNSPRSVIACKRQGIEQAELYQVCLQDIKNEIILPRDHIAYKKVLELKSQHYEQRRKEKIKIVAEEREQVIRDLDEGKFKIEEIQQYINTPYWNMYQIVYDSSNRDLKDLSFSKSLNRIKQQSAVDLKLQEAQKKHLEIIQDRLQHKEQKRLKLQAKIAKLDEIKQKAIEEFYPKRKVLQEHFYVKRQEIQNNQIKEKEEVFHKKDLLNERLDQLNQKLREYADKKNQQLKEKRNQRLQRVEYSKTSQSELFQKHSQWQQEVQRRLQESDLKVQYKRLKDEEDQVLKKEYSNLKRQDKEETAKRIYNVKIFEQVLKKKKQVEKLQYIASHKDILPQIRKEYSQTAQNFWKIRARSQSNQRSEQERTEADLEISSSIAEKFQFTPLSKIDPLKQAQMVKEGQSPLGVKRNRVGMPPKPTVSKAQSKIGFFDVDGNNEQTKVTLMMSPITNSLNERGKSLDQRQTYYSEMSNNIMTLETQEEHSEETPINALEPHLVQSVQQIEMQQEAELKPNQFRIKKQPKQGYLKGKIKKFRKNYSKQLNLIYQNMQLKVSLKY